MVGVDAGGTSSSYSVTVPGSGAFSVPVTVGTGTSIVVVTATSPTGGTAQTTRTVDNDVVNGTLLFDATDPNGDDNGPGNYAYPTSDDFKPGAYDLQDFQVYDTGSTVTFRVRTRDLTPTFTSPLGAQLVDVYVAEPGAATTSTAAAFPSRNYTARRDPWTRRIEVQGFGQQFVDASGATVGSVAITGNPISRYITFSVDKAALGGTPASGWTFNVVLTGQDGFSSDQARGFTADAGGLLLRSLRAGRQRPAVHRRPGNGAQGDGRADAERGQPGHRAGLHPRPGRPARGDRALMPGGG